MKDIEEELEEFSQEVKEDISDLKNMEFKQALDKLEEIVDKLEEGKLPLEDSLKEFITGIKLSSYCNQKLDQAEKKIEIVLKENDQFEEIVDFEAEEE